MHKAAELLRDGQRVLFIIQNTYGGYGDEFVPESLLTSIIKQSLNGIADELLELREVEPNDLVETLEANLNDHRNVFVDEAQNDEDLMEFLDGIDGGSLEKCLWLAFQFQHRNQPEDREGSVVLKKVFRNQANVIHYMDLDEESVRVAESRVTNDNPVVTVFCNAFNCTPMAVTEAALLVRHRILHTLWLFTPNPENDLSALRSDSRILSAYPGGVLTYAGELSEPSKLHKKIVFADSSLVAGFEAEADLCVSDDGLKLNCSRATTTLVHVTPAPDPTVFSGFHAQDVYLCDESGLIPVADGEYRELRTMYKMGVAEKAARCGCGPPPVFDEAVGMSMKEALLKSRRARK